MRRVITVAAFCAWIGVGAVNSSSGALRSHARAIPDLVVYGGTASGVMTAYSAARAGLHVVLLEPGSHLGGMVTGGLSATDIGSAAVIGGYVRQFYREAAQHYGDGDFQGAMSWRAEPHVLESIFDQMLEEAHVDVEFHERVREHEGVRRSGGKIAALITEDGREWPAAVFADCSYEGDVMEESGVEYTWGRESTQEYGESLAGVVAHTTHHVFTWPISAYGEDHHLLPEIEDRTPGAPGSGDSLVQSYNFRVILTDDPEQKLQFPRPEGYDASRFELLRRYIQQFAAHKGRPMRLDDLFLIVRIPGRKADFNNNGPFSTDYIGHSSRYPEAGFAERAAIWKEHLLYTQALFYFVAHDASVPESLRAEMNQWGLPRDEFADTAHWPNQLYIREGRRMRGAYVMRQSDLQSDRTKPDSIGMGAYNSDSHNVERIALPDGTVQNEGNVEVPVKPYEIAYRSITPKPDQVQNLLVPVCLSATHSAYSSVRMEPQYMIIGEAAGVAASLAVKAHTSVQSISVQELQAQLTEQGAILHDPE